MLPMTSPPPSRYLRSRDDRILGGVAGGLGRTFGVDAVIFRIAFAGLTLAGGIGVAAYLAALLVVPADDGTGNPAPRNGGWRTAATAVGGLLLFCATLALASKGSFWDGGWIFPVAVVAGLGYLVLRHRDGVLDLRRGPVVRLALMSGVGLGVLTAAALAFWASAWATAAGGGVAVAILVLGLGAALVAGAARGDRRARWLAVPALLIAFPAALVAAADISLDGGIGERTYRPAGADRLPAGYRLGLGELVVDLRDLDWSGGRRVDLDLQMGVGHTLVLVPPTVCVASRSRVGAGYTDVFGRDAGGVDIVHDVSRSPALDVPILVLDVHLGMGAFEVLNRRDDASSRLRDTADDRTSSDARRAAGRTADRACAGVTA